MTITSTRFREVSLKYVSGKLLFYSCVPRPQYFHIHELNEKTLLQNIRPPHRAASCLRSISIHLKTCSEINVKLKQMSQWNSRLVPQMAPSFSLRSCHLVYPWSLMDTGHTYFCLMANLKNSSSLQAEKCHVTLSVDDTMQKCEYFSQPFRNHI